jgi:tetratricopeptide (TPR) repeat protein
VEERFDNLMTKSNILEALNRKEEAAAVRNKALPLGNPVQLHSYGRQLQTQGKQEQAFEVYRANMKRYPDHWVAHNEAARLACAEGKFDEAAKHMKMSVAAAPDQFKSALEALVKRLEAKEDINR